MFIFHNSCNVPVSELLFQKEHQPCLTQRPCIFVLRSLRGYYIHFTEVQNRMSAFETKPNEANMGTAFNKAGFSPLVLCCMFNSTLDSDFDSAILQSEELQDKLFSVWFAGHCLFLFFCEPSPNAWKSRNASQLCAQCNMLGSIVMGLFFTKRPATWWKIKVLANTETRN